MLYGYALKILIFKICLKWEVARTETFTKSLVRTLQAAKSLPKPKEISNGKEEMGTYTQNI